MRNNLAFATIFKSASALLVTIFSASCNHVFYQPHEKLYGNPSSLNLEYESFSVVSKDKDVELQAWHIKPKGGSKNVAIMQFHGNAENRSTHFRSVAWLAELGADVIVFDYRGYDGSTGSPSREGLVNDGIAMIDWMSNKFPNNRRYVIAQSLGGAVAIPSIVQGKSQLDGLIVESSFHSYRGLGRMKLNGIWLTWPFQWLPWLLLSGNLNPMDDAANLNIPVLAFHDRYDPVVPLESGLLLYSSVPSSKIKVKILEGNRHIGALHSDRLESIATAVQFLGLRQ
ncbi:MAG: alpha/beta hydrolase [Proteobacteria bacterium]|nr:alpha/beta hydrolase [Pseudomonadota bacterium]